MGNKKKSMNIDLNSKGALKPISSATARRSSARDYITKSIRGDSTTRLFVGLTDAEKMDTISDVVKSAGKKFKHAKQVTSAKKEVSRSLYLADLASENLRKMKEKKSAKDKDKGKPSLPSKGKSPSKKKSDVGF